MSRSCREMRAICVDQEGILRCWNCGTTGLFSAARDSHWRRRAKGNALAPLVTCQTCGSANWSRTIEPFSGPASQRWQRIFAEQAAAVEAARRVELECSEPEWGADLFTTVL
ncbi:MAG: hypothetical protein ACO3ME_08830 [Ilumatobacteraceae bacterium]